MKRAHAGRAWSAYSRASARCAALPLSERLELSGVEKRRQSATLAGEHDQPQLT
jgi:hypothetical protein